MSVSRKYKQSNTALARTSSNGWTFPLYHIRTCTDLLLFSTTTFYLAIALDLDLMHQKSCGLNLSKRATNSTASTHSITSVISQLFDPSANRPSNRAFPWIQNHCMQSIPSKQTFLEQPDAIKDARISCAVFKSVSSNPKQSKMQSALLLFSNISWATQGYQECTQLYCSSPERPPVPAFAHINGSIYCDSQKARDP